jgi:thiamine transporter ThiT
MQDGSHLLIQVFYGLFGQFDGGFIMKNKISTLGVLSALAVLLQGLAGIIPFLGHITSVFSSLPIIFAMRLGVKAGFLSYFCAGFLVFIIQPYESIIFFK